jgi:hypothetical protein
MFRLIILLLSSQEQLTLKIQIDEEKEQKCQKERRLSLAFQAHRKQSMIVFNRRKHHISSRTLMLTSNDDSSSTPNGSLTRLYRRKGTEGNQTKINKSMIEGRKVFERKLRESVQAAAEAKNKLVLENSRKKQEISDQNVKAVMQAKMEKLKTQNEKKKRIRDAAKERW